MRIFQADNSECPLSKIQCFNVLFQHCNYPLQGVLGFWIRRYVKRTPGFLPSLGQLRSGHEEETTTSERPKMWAGYGVGMAEGHGRRGL